MFQRFVHAAHRHADPKYCHLFEFLFSGYPAQPPLSVTAILRCIFPITQSAWTVVTSLYVLYCNTTHCFSSCTTFSAFMNYIDSRRVWSYSYWSQWQDFHETWCMLTVHLIAPQKAMKISSGSRQAREKSCSNSAATQVLRPAPAPGLLATKPSWSQPYHTGLVAGINSVLMWLHSHPLGALRSCWCDVVCSKPAGIVLLLFPTWAQADLVTSTCCWG